MKSLQKRKITNSEYHFGKSVSAFKCAALFSTMLSCSQTEVPQEPSNGVLLEQYSGKITRDLLDDGTYSDPYQANRYYVKYKNPTTKEDASSFANSLSNTKIVGYMLPLNIFVYETSEDNRDPSIEYFSNKQEVVDYAARVYYLYKKSSPQWDNEILANSGSDLEKKGLWGVQKTELTAGLIN